MGMGFKLPGTALAGSCIAQNQQHKRSEEALNRDQFFIITLLEGNHRPKKEQAGQIY